MRSPSELIASSARADASPRTWTAWHRTRIPERYFTPRHGRALPGGINQCFQRGKVLGTRFGGNDREGGRIATRRRVRALEQCIGNAAHRRNDDHHARPVSGQHNVRRLEGMASALPTDVPPNFMTSVCMFSSNDSAP